MAHCCHCQSSKYIRADLKQSASSGVITRQRVHELGQEGKLAISLTPNKNLHLFITKTDHKTHNL